MPKSTRSAQLAGQTRVADGWADGMDQQYELVDVDDIKEHPDNYNRGDEEKIAESMDENGWFGAVLVQRSTGYIIAHNHAYRVAKRKGALQVPVIWKDVDDVEALRIMLADNETARRSTPDQDQLGVLLGILGSVKGTGLDALEGLEAADEAATKATKEAEGASGGGDDGEDFPTQYGVIVICADEEDQARVFEWLSGEGLSVKVVTI